ncbi:PKD domain-containing protein, partial [Pontibacter toksunensis]
GSGSTNPADGRPGVLYVGDVGYGLWEDLNVVTRAGMNFGWPLFEGLTPHNGYMSKKTYNAYAPNPLYNTGGCTQQYFYFQDLIKQETASGTASFTNPCNTAQAIPAGANTFLHSRPVIDWRHGTNGGPSRTGIFNGETAAEVNIGAPGSPVSGPQFGGNAVVAGVFYTHDDFPPEYWNTLFFGDYTGKWLRNLTVDAFDKPTAVRNFISSGAVVVHMATHPTEDGIYYVNFPSEIRKVTYNSINQPPVAVASPDKTFGPGPLTVQFTGSNSYELDGQPLSYRWDFGDSTTSTLADPSHTFNSAADTLVSYNVTLTVRDSQGSADSISMLISVNNTPPQVTITSPTDNMKYPMTSESTYSLKATVSDAEHSSSQLTYRWQTILHHEDHQHPEPAVTSQEAVTTISPLGCGAEAYFYRVKLTVTDAAGLATTREISLYPDCNTSTTPIVRELWENVTGTAISDIPVNTRQTSTSELLLFEAPVNAGDNYGARVRAYVQAPINGDYVFWIASDQDSELWLSTDESPSTKRKIASVSGATDAREWTRFASQTSEAVTLQAGRKYYIEALHKESTGADHLAVGWQLPDGALERPIPGLRLSPFVPAPSQPPVANAGADVSITLPANSVTLSGSGTDSDGTISGYSWSQVSGPLATLSGAATPNLRADSLLAGTYVFRLTVTDNESASSSDDVTVTVVPANVAPTVSAGSDLSITYPTNSVTLSGSGSDSDGTVSSYEWGQLSGPSTALFSSHLVASPIVSELMEGVYVFRLKATDNQEASSYDEVTVTVHPASVAPVANAGPDKTITLPTSSVQLSGSATDSDGTISGYSWSQVSGPNTAT